MNAIITAVFFIACIAYLVWGVRVLPKENRQFLAVFPVKKLDCGSWQGINLTWYGVLVANSVLAAAVVFVVLTASVGIAAAAVGLILTAVLLFSLPAARILAGWIEKKDNTFSTGAASFAGLLASYPAILLAGQQGKMLAILAALTISYCVGEGLGRLACISFGCCYGKPLDKSPPLLRRLFAQFHFVFHGETKKIAYENGWDDIPVVPIQALTAGISLAGAFAGWILFSLSHFAAAFLVSLTVSQAWRFVSEFFRSDHRGTGNWNVYQILPLAAIALGFATVFAASPPQPFPIALALGVEQLGQPESLLVLSALWLIVTVYLGRSRVTRSVISISVCKERI